MSRGLLFFCFVFLAFGSSVQGNSWRDCNSTEVSDKRDVTNNGIPTVGAVDNSCLSANQQYKCCNNLYVKPCSSCSSGYTQKTQIVNVDGGGACNGYSFQVCVKDQVSECDNCGGKCNGEVWVDLLDGYQHKTKEDCNYSSCDCFTLLTDEYRCAPGWYATGDVSCKFEGWQYVCSGCEKCSAKDKVYGADKNEDCVSIVNWVRYSEGYEYKKNANFNSEDCSCEITKEYRCAAGWYGIAFYNFSTRGVGGCSQCLTVGNIFMDKNLKEKARGTSTAGNNSKKDSCYLPTGDYFMKSGAVKIENTVSSMCTY